MTLLAYRPELATALEEESIGRDLSKDARQELMRIHKQITALTIPLTRAQSLPDAEKVVTRIESDYLHLGERWTELLLASGLAYEKLGGINEQLPDKLSKAEFVDPEVKQQWSSVLDSAHASAAWLNQRGDDALRTDNQEDIALVANVTEQARSPVVRFEAVKNAIDLILSEAPGATPKAIPMLVELADRCWTEVEDVFLSLAEYDDDGGTVPLSEVKTELGL